MDQYIEKIREEEQKRAEYLRIPTISYDEMMAVVNKWLVVVDPGVVKLTLATIVANRIESDPVWLFLIAPSSGGKTEILNGLLKVPECYSISQITPNTFLSGFKKKDTVPSLLHRLGSGKTLLFKDFTTVLEGNADAKREIIAQMREIYDGRAIKVTGSGDEIVWEGKLGFIACCTPILEVHMSMMGAMGERFLSYYIEQPTRDAIRERMKVNIGHEKQMREEIQNAMAGYLKGMTINELPTLPAEVAPMLDALTDFVAVSRAVVMRSRDSKRDIEYIVEPEMIGRAYKQFYTLALALVAMNGGTWTEVDSHILRRIAISSVHSLRYSLIKKLGAYSTKVKTTTIAQEMGYPTSTVRRYLEDLSAISMDKGTVRIITRTHQGTGKPDLWELTPHMRMILESMGEHIEQTKTDSGFDQDEEDAPYTTGDPQIDALGLTPAEAAAYGI